MGELPFLEVQDDLAARCGVALDQAQTDDERGRVILNFILERERLRHGLTDPGPRRDALDRETLAKLNGPADLGPEHSISEVVFRRLCENPASAAAYLESAMQQRSKAQSKRARQQRPGSRGAITRVIEDILEDDPDMCAKDVGFALEQSAEISLIEDEYRHSFDGSTLKVSNLASRVSDARKRVSGQPG